MEEKQLRSFMKLAFRERTHRVRPLAPLQSDDQCLSFQRTRDALVAPL